MIWSVRQESCWKFELWHEAMKVVQENECEKGLLDGLKEKEEAVVIAELPRKPTHNNSDARW